MVSKRPTEQHDSAARSRLPSHRQTFEPRRVRVRARSPSSPVVAAALDMIPSSSCHQARRWPSLTQVRRTRSAIVARRCVPQRSSSANVWGILLQQTGGISMLVADPVLVAARDVSLVHNSFRSWQRDSVLNGSLPMIGIAGTRGKSTVLRLVEEMLVTMHLRRATWTDLGVQIQGRRQRGEIAGWRHALTRLSEGSIDVALQELDWATVNAAGLPAGTYPVLVLTGLRDLAE